MVTRKLRFESLELRRLFTIDLDLTSTQVSEPTVALYSLADEESTDGSRVGDHPNPVIADDIVWILPAPLVPGPFDQMGSPFLMETEQHLVVARPNYSDRSTDIHLVVYKTDGSPAETAEIKIDLQVDRMLELGNMVVLFGSQYESQSTLDLNPTRHSNSLILVIDPSSQQIVYEASLLGTVIQAIELPGGIAFETVTPKALAQTVTPTATNGLLSSSEASNQTTIELSTNFESNYTIGYLHLTEVGVDLTQQEIEGISTLAYFGEALVAVSPNTSAASITPSYVIKRWNNSEHRLPEVDSIGLPAITSEWEYLQSIEVSPTGSQLLVSRASQELLSDETWNQKLTLDWLQQDQDRTSLRGSYTIESFIGSARWLNEKQILLLPYDASTELSILDITDSTEPILSKISLPKRLQLHQIVPISNRHIALIGSTPVRPDPNMDALETIPDAIPMVVTNLPQGAMVIIDLQENLVTDEQTLGPNTMIDQPLAVTSLANHFAWRSLTTQPDWSFDEVIQVGRVDDRGKLVIVDQLSLESNWTYHRSNGSTLTLLSTNFLEQRTWSDLAQVNWRVEFEPHLLERVPVPELIESKNSDDNIQQLQRGEPSVTTIVTSDMPMDTNGDGMISSMDVLLVINHINRAYSEENPEALLINSSATLHRFDIDDDGRVLPTDALMMIASMHIFHTTFESTSDTSNNSEWIEKPDFWDMLPEDQELQRETVEATLDSIFGGLVDAVEMSMEREFWYWFAPMDPWADRISRHWNSLEPDFVS